MVMLVNGKPMETRCDQRFDRAGSIVRCSRRGTHQVCDTHWVVCTQHAREWDRKLPERRSVDGEAA